MMNLGKFDILMSLTVVSMILGGCADQTKNYSGTTTGDLKAPGLFDERRTEERCEGCTLLIDH